MVDGTGRERGEESTPSARSNEESSSRLLSPSEDGRGFGFGFGFGGAGVRSGLGVFLTRCVSFLESLLCLIDLLTWTHTRTLF